LWQPKGPDRMEIWSWSLVENDAPSEIADFARDMQIRTFSPSGIFEQDDVEMWIQATRHLGGFFRSRFGLNYQMGWGHEESHPDRPGLLHASPTEIGVFGFYERWRELMSGAQVGR
jgi:3-phenylpropionate/trans-cinnamate dioxygenase subunit alpha